VAYAELTSDVNRRAIVVIRAIGAFGLLINGAPIDAGAASRDVATVDLVRGVNRFVLTTRPGQGPWQFACLVSEADDPAPKPSPAAR
jgi:hypothetical protein